MGFLRQESWSGWPLPSGGFPNPGVEPASPALQAGYLSLVPPLPIFLKVFLPPGDFHATFLSRNFIRIKWLTLCLLPCSLSQTVLHIYSQGPGAQHPSARRDWPQTVSELQVHPSSQRSVHFPCCSTRTAATLTATGSPGHFPHTPTPRGHTLCAVTDGHSSPRVWRKHSAGSPLEPTAPQPGPGGKGAAEPGTESLQPGPRREMLPSAPNCGVLSAATQDTHAHTHATGITQNARQLQFSPRKILKPPPSGPTFYTKAQHRMVSHTAHSLQSSLMHQHVIRVCKDHDFQIVGSDLQN